MMVGPVHTSSTLSSSAMEPVLFLVHRIPFPPNKGDKVRSFHLLKFLVKLGLPFHNKGF